MDFDAPDYGFKEEDKSPRKARNEAILKSLVEKCNDGVFATMAEAVEGLAIPRTRLTKLWVMPLLSCLDSSWLLWDLGPKRNWNPWE